MSNAHSHNIDRKRRAATALAMIGVVLASVSYAENRASASTEAKPTYQASAADAGSTIGMASTQIGCGLAPTPWTCGAAVGTTLTWFNTVGQEPLPGDSDMTQFGPMAAL